MAKKWRDFSLGDAVPAMWNTGLTNVFCFLWVFFESRSLFPLRLPLKALWLGLNSSTQARPEACTRVVSLFANTKKSQTHPWRQGNNGKEILSPEAKERYHSKIFLQQQHFCRQLPIPKRIISATSWGKITHFLPACVEKRPLEKCTC